MQLHHLVDGTQPLTPAVVAGLDTFIDRIEDAPADVIPILDVTGTPELSHADRPTIGLVNKWERVLRRLERVKRPTMAVVDGDCGGIALEALLVTDLRLATTDARLHLPAGPGGVWPGMGLYRLANQVGFARMRRSVLFGGVIGAADAVDKDLVDEVTADMAAAIAAAVMTLGSTIGQDVAVRRQLMLDATTTPFEEAFGRHLAACDRVLRRTEIEEASDVPALL
jgi:isomerase DpgB